MPRFVAFLRGVSPQNARMPDLQRCFEDAGFARVRTLLSSGNVVFDADAAPLAELESRADAAMQAGLGRGFASFVRGTAALRAMLDADPFAAHALPPAAKRVVTFLRQPAPAELRLPIEREGATILQTLGTEVYTAYVPVPGRPVFMKLLEDVFGGAITTRSLDTVRKCAGA